MSLIKRTIKGKEMYIPKDVGGIHPYLRSWNENTNPREPYFEKLLSDEVEPGMVVYEIGANIGYQTLIILESLKGKGKINAFEPDVNNNMILRKNMEDDSVVNIYDFAISNINGFIDFHLAEGSSNLSSISQTKHSTRRVEVETYSITELVNEKGFDVPNFIKMDIEGAEAFVFDGMIDLIKEKDFDCKILFETHPNMYDECDIETPLREMFESGFKARYVVSATVKHPKQFKERGYEPILDSLHGDRALFENVSDDDLIYFLKSEQKEWHQAKGKYGKIVRYIMLERKND